MAKRRMRELRRPPVEGQVIDDVLDRMRKAWIKTIRSKGKGSFASSHEAFGVIAEEVTELATAIQSKESGARQKTAAMRQTDKIDAEIVDIVVAGLHALASRQVGGMDW